MKRDGSKWTSLAALLVFTLFALCLMLVLLTGAGVYRRLAEGGEAGFSQNTAAQYIATRTHQGRAPEIQDFEGCKALVFTETYDTEVYLTRVYLYDGWLRELFSAEAAGLSPRDGEKILEAESLDFDLEDGLLTVRLNGEEFLLSPREGRVLE